MVVMAAEVVVGVDCVIVGCVVVEICVLTGLQQNVAIPLHQYPVLAIDDHAASATQRSTSHFQEFCRRIRCEHEVLVSSHKHVDQGKSSGENHPVGDDW